MRSFIPIELIEKHPNSTFRGIYKLPEYGDVFLVMVVQEFLQKYGNEAAIAFIISYNRNGVIIDYQILGGQIVDVWESFFEVKQEYNIIQKSYRHEFNIDIKGCICFLETIVEYNISSDGHITETHSISREGYFESILSGYRYVMPSK